MRRALILLAALALGSCATSREHWGDEEEAPPSGRASASSRSSSSSAPPKSFVMAQNGDAEAAADSDNDDTAPPKPKERHPIPVTIAVTRDNEGEDAKRMSSPEGVPLHDANAPVDPKATLVVPEPSGAPEKLPMEETPKETKKRKKKHDEEAAAKAAEAPAPQGLVVEATPDAETPPPAVKVHAKKQSTEINDDEADDDSVPHAAGAMGATEDAEPGATHAAPAEPAIDEPRNSDRSGDGAGISVLAGVGGLIQHNASSNYAGSFAYGGQFSWTPAFLGYFGLDVGFWRAGMTTGGGFETVNSSQNTGIARLVFLPRFGPGLFGGGGLGAIVTFNTAQYTLAAPSSSQGNVTSPVSIGGDASLAFGYKVSYFEARIDGHLLVTGTARLEFLPTVTVGVAF